MRRVWHSLIAGHQWAVMAQGICKPDDGVAQWASKCGKVELIVKARWGWSECLLVCDCGAYVKIEVIGSKGS